MKKVYADKIQDIQREMQKVIVGQDELIRDLLIGLFAKGHVLLEGVPGLGKTLAISTLSKIVDGKFQRIQFTPDLLPSDLIGARVFHQNSGEFSVKKGPIFSNFVLADEINRSPAKVQSALLEAMAERQVTIADETFLLDSPFMVLATQNPIEQDGTYSLPEAQLDRFLLKTIVSYPSEDDEILIMKQNMSIAEKVQKQITKKEILEIQKYIENEIFVDDSIYMYVKDLVFYTRRKDSEIGNLIQFGASPRASIALIKTAKVLAFIKGREYVIPEDITTVIYPVLRHRIILSYEALADNISVETIIDILLKHVVIK